VAADRRRQAQRRQHLVARGGQAGIRGGERALGLGDVGPAPQQFGRQAGRDSRRPQGRELGAARHRPGLAPSSRLSAFSCWVIERSSWGTTAAVLRYSASAWDSSRREL
jgi:hypothetical protein